MDLTTVLAFHLRGLVDGLGAEDDAITDALTALVGHLDDAVTSYLGLRLSIVVDGWPVTLTAFPPLDGARPVTSLRLALSALGRDFDQASQIVFYAGTPGTFVDLTADLDYLHGPRPPVALDVELPPPTVESGFTGLTEFTTVNRAVGMLLERGHHPDEARATLQRRASAAGLDVPGYAARVLED